MSRWLKNVNTLLEKLDDQVENVRDVLTEQQDSDEDEEYYSEDEEEEEEDEDEESEEEEIDLEGGDADTAQESLFPSSESPATPKPPHGPPPASDKIQEANSQGSVPKQQATSGVAPAKQAPAIPAKNEQQKLPPPAAAAAQTAKAVPATPPPRQVQQATKSAPKPRPSPSQIKKVPTTEQDGGSKPEPAAPKPPTTSSSNRPQAAKPSALPPPPAKGPPPKQATTAQPPKQQAKPNAAPPQPSKAPSSSGGTGNKQQVLAEMRQLRKKVMELQTELNAANKEIKAQQKELNHAATIVEQERKELKEEKEEIQEDHEEEMDNLKSEYEEKIAKIKADFKQKMDDMKAQLHQEKAERQQEGGDLSQDLEDALQRERDALQELSRVQTDKTNSEQQVQKLKSEKSSLEERLDNALASQTTAEQRQQQAEQALDDATEQHKRQLKQRQSREAELEKTIADLGAALTEAGSSNAAQSQAHAAAITAKHNEAETTYFKEQWELATEEIETLKGQLNLETQRCEALRRELDDINKERTQEQSTYQENQRQYDHKIQEQLSIISRLESQLRDYRSAGETSGESDNGREEGSHSATIQHLQRQLDESQVQIQRLSEQLLRQQGMADVHKSEILALKGRLQAANQRADEAEKMSFASPMSATNRMYESEGGSSGYKMKRRVKGRSGMIAGGRGNVTVRSIRAALNMGPGSPMEGLGKNIDALDAWMIDTGAILRHEPLARLGFFIYFSILHLWCFCLVAFHATEPAKGDFPSSLRGANTLRGAQAGPP